VLVATRDQRLNRHFASLQIRRATPERLLHLKRAIIVFSNQPDLPARLPNRLLRNTKHHSLHQPRGERAGRLSGINFVVFRVRPHSAATPRRPSSVTKLCFETAN
jgi:hypothetical protein